MRPEVFPTPSAVFLGLLGLLAIPAGCRAPSSGRTAPTQSDRLMNAYPELRSGRFALIADFEDPAQMEIIQTISVSDAASCLLSAGAGRKETGAGSLSFTAASEDDTIVIANQRGQGWYLKRDWRAYDLLMMSVHAPTNALSLNVSISGGPAARRSTAFTRVALDPGWNVLRLDLAEVGERVLLDDVREIRLSVSGLSRATTLAIDDVILTGHRVAIFGDPDNTGGDLYVQQVGRRLRIGVGGDFELIAANGQVRGWYNLADDPHRLRNLLYESTLNPNPVVVGEGDGGGGLGGPGETVVALHRLVEANAVRVVWECEWRFVEDPSRARAGLDAFPFQRWRYTMYPTGQIYVLVESSDQADGGGSPPLGLAVTLATPSSGGVRTYIPHVEYEDGRTPMFATLSNPGGGAEVLFVPDLTEPTSRFVERISEDRRSVSVVAVDDREQTPVKRWVTHLHLSAPTQGSTKDAAVRALDALGLDSPVRIERGTPLVSPNAPTRPDGFNPIEGCYALAPDAGRVRVVFEAGRRAVFSPAFCIPAETGRDVWVYVDHLAHKNVVTNDAGQLLFQLSGDTNRKRVVEVLFRSRQSTSIP